MQSFHLFALDFFAKYGYTSPLAFDQSLTYAEARDQLNLISTDVSERALGDDQIRVHLLFQFTADQLKTQNALFAARPDRDLYDAFVFLALDLRDGSYSRSDLAALARQFNQPFASPVIVLFRHGDTLSLASVARRQNKTDADKHVLQKVSLLKEIRLENPHRAHLDILGELENAKASAHNWAEFLASWNRVLDISELNRKFYADYKLVFEAVEQQVRGIEADTADAKARRVRDWTQRLFNRLLFLRFLEKKGWLEFDGSPDYLRALWQAPRTAGQTFLQDRLYWAFFHGLNANVEGHALSALVERRGHVPPLNGGLFEMQDDLDQKGAVWFADENLVFGSILGLFGRYVFTVAENTPLEEEVGVDPEMLGKVFEELVTGRHESGSYYTPRGIVSFMAREAIKGYLAQSGAREAIEKLVDEDDASDLRDPEEVLRALREVTICDPACGSGAYLLGTMQELLRLRETLFAAHAKDHQKIYDRKLEIIARNLYGVDKDPFATNIAMLRLWLSLVVEYEGPKPPPLPNLKYKIENGDSLAAPLGGQLTLDQNTVDEFNRKKAAFVKACGDEKRQLDGEIETLRAELRAWSQTDEGFDWRIEFAEIFAPGAGRAGGFDIVLANPPYIRMELFKDQKPTLKKNFPQVHDERADLYVYFYARALELLKVGGELTFISPNQWLRATYGAKLRAYFAANSHIQTIVDFGDLPVFQSATTYPMVYVARKGIEKGETYFTRVKSLEAPYPDVLALVKEGNTQLPPDAFDGKDWKFSNSSASHKFSTMKARSQTLGDFTKGKIYRGVVTGLNKAFIINTDQRNALVRASASCEQVIKPVLAGRDIRRWTTEDNGKWLIYTTHGISVEGIEPILDYLRPYKDQLEARATEQEWYELQQPQEKFVGAYESPKIVCPDIAATCRFAFDTDLNYVANTAYAIPIDDLYLLAVLNSDAVAEFYADISPKIRGGYLRFIRQYLEQIPIPNAATADQGAIASLVEACLSQRGQGCEAQEAEINARVAALYGLD